MAGEQYKNLRNASAAQGSLSAQLNAGATSMSLGSGEGANFSVPCTVRIEDEIIYVATKSGDDLTGLTRAAESIIGVGAVDATHAAGKAVNQVLTDASLRRLPGVTGDFAIKGPHPWIDVRAYGAVGDVLSRDDFVTTNASTTVTAAGAAFTAADVGKKIALAGGGSTRTSSADGAMANGSSALTATATFTQADVGAWITVPNAGPASADLVTRVRAFVSATCVLLESAASSTVSGKTVTVSQPLVSSIASVTNGTTITLANAASASLTTSGLYGTDDAAAIQAALDAVSAGGGVVLVPAGDYWLSTAMQIDTGGTTLQGAGVQATVLYMGNVSGDGIAVGDGSTNPVDIVLEGFTIQGVGARTGGRAIHLRNAHSARVSRARCLTCIYDAVVVEGGANEFDVHLDQVTVDRGRRGVVIGQPTMGGTRPQDTYLRNCLIFGCTVGIEITDASGVYMTDLEILQCIKNGVRMDAQAGSLVAWVFGTSVLCDTTGGDVPAAQQSSVAGWCLTGASTGVVEGVMLANCWGATTAVNADGYGFLAEFAGNGTTTGVFDVHLIGGAWVNNGGHGVFFFDGVSHWSVVGAQILSNGASASGSFHGVVAGTGCAYFRIVGCLSGPGGGFTNPQSYGVIVFGSSNHYVITGNDLSGNLADGLLDLADGADRQVFGNLPQQTSEELLTAGTIRATAGLGTKHEGASTPTGGQSGDIRVGDGKIWVQDAGTWKSVAVS